MTKIKVVDSIMGSGKTTSIINKMNDDKENNYIFITPYLNEVERIKRDCPNRKFYDPKIYSKDGNLVTKHDSLHNLLSEEKNIVTTHALFKRSNEETRELIHAGNYILVLDEVMDVVEQLNLKKNDLNILMEQGLITISDNGLIKWNENKKDFDTRYNDIRDMAINNTLFFYRNTVFLWTFPVDIFTSFQEVYVLTYMFDGQIQRYYYDFFGIEYKYFYADKVNNEYVIKERSKNYIEYDLRKEYKELINIYNGKLNSIGDKKFTLSSTWYEEKTKPTVNKVKNNIKNYFTNIRKAKSKDIIWTCYKRDKAKLSGNGYTRGWLALNTRATNDYKERTELTYAVNRFLHPYISGFFLEKGVRINEEGYALSEMIQWIWRSAIRDKKEIHIYIPSERMRHMLILWLNGENYELWDDKLTMIKYTKEES